jgi:hypothetical protein
MVVRRQEYVACVVSQTLGACMYHGPRTARTYSPRVLLHKGKAGTQICLAQSLDATVSTAARPNLASSTTHSQAVGLKVAARCVCEVTTTSVRPRLQTAEAICLVAPSMGRAEARAGRVASRSRLAVKLRSRQCMCRSNPMQSKWRASDARRVVSPSSKDEGKRFS